MRWHMTNTSSEIKARVRYTVNWKPFLNTNKNSEDKTVTPVQVLDDLCNSCNKIYSTLQVTGAELLLKIRGLDMQHIKLSRQSTQGIHPTAHALLLHHTTRRYVQACIKGTDITDIRDLTEAIAALIVAKQHHLYTAGEANLITLIFTQTDEGTHTSDTIQQIAACLNQICEEMPKKTEVATTNIGEDASVVKLNVMTIQQAINEARHDFRYFEQPKNQLK
jgi:hypothetical protein